jgi:hypothetical protein
VAALCARRPRGERSHLVDENQLLGVGLTPSHEVIDVGLPGADRAWIDDLGVVVFGRMSDANGLIMHIRSDAQPAGLGHG